MSCAARKERAALANYFEEEDEATTVSEAMGKNTYQCILSKLAELILEIVIKGW